MLLQVGIVLIEQRKFSTEFCNIESNTNADVVPLKNVECLMYPVHNELRSCVSNQCVYIDSKYPNSPVKYYRNLNVWLFQTTNIIKDCAQGTDEFSIPPVTNPVFKEIYFYADACYNLTWLPDSYVLSCRCAEVKRIYLRTQAFFRPNATTSSRTRLPQGNMNVRWQDIMAIRLQLLVTTIRMVWRESYCVIL